VKRLGLVTGEASGDLIVRDALVALRAHMPDLALEGVGGPQLAALGMDCWARSEQLAVRGYVEVLQRLPALLRLRKALTQRWVSQPPHLFLGVDAPDFNLALEARLRTRGIPTAHLVSPSIWAWRPERLAAIAAAVDHMLCLFPHEPALYAPTRVRAHYVGHPLADLVPCSLNPLSARHQLGLPESDVRPVLVLMPGSRQAELSRLGPIFFQTALRFSRSHQILLPVPSQAARLQLEGLPGYAALRDLGMRIVGPLSPDPARPASHLALEAADLALIASGTATLEAALYQVPQVVAYQVPWLTERLMRRKAIVSRVSLPNLLLKQDWVPELLQQSCEPNALEQALRAWEEDPVRRRDYREVTLGLLDQLRRNAAQQVALVLQECLT